MSDIASRLASLSPEQRQALDKLLRQKRAAAAEPSIRRLAPTNGPAPLSFGQHRLWFLHRLDPQSSVYNVHTTIDVSEFEAVVVRRAVNEIVRRHEVLRTTFRETSGVVVPVVASELDVPLPAVDLSARPEATREEMLTRLASDLAHQPFDLQRGPLVRGSIVELGENTRLLLIAMHHIVTDGWSMDVFARELRALGTAFSAGAPSPLPPLTAQYGDFAAWQRDRFQGATLESQLEWWRRTLEGAPPVLELPIDRPRPAVQSDEGAFQAVVSGPASSARLRELARREASTLFTVLLAAFEVLLYRFTGQRDLVVGLPVGGRTRAELEPLIGFFVNTVVLRTDLSGDPPFTALVARVRHTITEALAHQDLPFERLVAALAPDRHLSRSPLFQVMAQFLGNETLSDDYAGGPLEPGEVEHGTSLFDLSIDFSDTPHGIRSTIQYSTDLFEHDTITRLLHRWRLLLDAVAEDPGRAISQLPVMPAAERTFVLETCNATTVAFPPAPNVSALFARQVERSPDAPAIVGEHETLSYRQLRDRVAQLADALRGAGVGPEVIVGICMERSPALVVAILAVLEAGGAYTPIDPSTPVDRIGYVLQDTKAPLVLTQSWLLDRLPAERCPTMCLDRDASSTTTARASHRSAADGDSLAYVIYTSGSTGRPKGVMITQAALLNFVRGAIAVYGITSGDRVLQFASIAFDTSIEETLGSLLTGATLVLRTAGMLESVERFLADCGALGVTVLDPPTAFWHLLVQSLASGEARLPPSVRLVIFGSERALPERLLDWDQAVGSRVRLMHGYGPTETTVVATVADLTTPAGGRPVTREVPIGAPVPNVYVYIVDEHGQPVPIGVQGEGWIGGDQVARGYLNQPEATARAFIDDPFRPGGRVYRTGDRLSRRPDGQILFHGRVDDQIKIRGYRVEPGEVESVLAQHPAVQECAVVAAPAPAGGLQLVGCVTPVEGRTVAAVELRAFLEGTLPAYMVPAIVIVDRLPLTVTGKVDRARLVSAVTGATPPPSRTPRPPASEIERTVADVWSFVLSAPEVGLDDDFFELGGHSLLALQIVGRLKADHGFDVPLRALFEHPRLEDFVHAVAAAPPSSREGDGALAPVARAPHRAQVVDGRLIVSDALRRLLSSYAVGARRSPPSGADSARSTP